jgi:hypothetical protein
MKLSASVTISITLLCSPMHLATAQSNGFPPSARLVSRQGWPGEQDVIAHKHISKGTHFKCIQVEHHPKGKDDAAGCLLRFDQGGGQTLPYGKETEAAVDSDVYLECTGDKPTKCTVGLW